MGINEYLVDDKRARGSSNANNDGTKPIKPVRKKFAMPPVKVACLEWQVKLDSLIDAFNLTHSQSSVPNPL